MISYELAKKLEEAGFPKDKGLINAEEDKEKYGWFTCDGAGDAYIDGKLYLGSGAYADEIFTHYEPYEESVYVPTLSELIEECEDRFSELVRTEQGNWYTIETSQPHLKPEDDNTGMWGTPEEAVANLFISLNSK